MGKKYLLYIHDERFEVEPLKSGLVNLLLARHYQYFQPGKLVEELPEEDQELHKDATYCKHGYLLGTRMCKKGCR